jgi:3-phosphoshikimate 1-carboxyvinyltransferase
MAVASAQVKSALLLAGLFADSPTTIHQPSPTRDHTERMLTSMGATINSNGLSVTIFPCKHLTPLSTSSERIFHVPGDISSAAFPIVAALIIPDSKITIQNVGINPTRTGLIDVLSKMGANIVIESIKQGTEDNHGEPVANLTIQTSNLQGIEIKGDTVVRMIDEFPIFAVAATQANGKTIVRNAEELRVKETDRISTVVTELKKLGAHIEALPDGFIIDGPTQLFSASVDSHNDHRLAMALAVAGLIASGDTVVQNVEWIEDSFPGFIPLMQSLSARYT